jgi:hypothetical protein
MKTFGSLKRMILLIGFYKKTPTGHFLWGNDLFQKIDSGKAIQLNPKGILYLWDASRSIVG